MHNMAVAPKCAGSVRGKVAPENYFFNSYFDYRTQRRRRIRARERLQRGFDASDEEFDPSRVSPASRVLKFNQRRCRTLCK